MKKIQKIGYMAIGAVLALAISVTLPALAASVTKQITAYYNDIKIYVDGSLITPKDVNGNIVDPFIADGTTYLPVRAVGEALGKTVEWDGGTQSVYIGPKPGAVQYMTDILPAYEFSNKDYYKEYCAAKSLMEKGTVDKFTLGGVEYSDGFMFSSPMNGNVNLTWAVWNLNGQYNSLDGILCHVDGTDTGTGPDAVLEIYCDGVLREVIPLSDDMPPTPISIDLRGVNQLKILTGISKGTYKSFWGFFGLGNPVLK